MTEKTKIGIPGVDELLNGGVPKGDVVLVSGPTGSGKTTFCLQFLYAGIMEFGESGIYVTLDEPAEDVRRNALERGWDIGKLEKENKLRIVDLTHEIADEKKQVNAFQLSLRLDDIATEIRARRLVIDPIAALAMQNEDKLQYRYNLLKLRAAIKNLHVTSLLGTEAMEGSAALSRYGVEEFVSDGIIMLYYFREGGKRTRGIEVRKLRGSQHKEGIFPMTLTAKGIEAYPTSNIAKLSV